MLRPMGVFIDVRTTVGTDARRAEVGILPRRCKVRSNGAKEEEEEELGRWPRAEGTLIDRWLPATM